MTITLPLRRLRLAALLALALALFLSSGVLAQSANPVADAIAGLQKNGYYVSPNADAAMKSKGISDAESKLRSAVNDLKGRGYDVKLAMVETSDLGNYAQNKNVVAYAAYLHDNLGMGNGILVVTDITGGVGAKTNKLDTNTISTILTGSDIRARLTSNVVDGTIAYARALQDKIIGGDESSRNTTITLVVIVGLIILIVAAITFTNLNKKWQERLAAAKQTSSDLSAQVVTMGSNLDFLKLQNQSAYDQVTKLLNPGNQLLSDANDKLSKLKRPNPVSLVFQYGKLDDDLRDVEAALDSAKGAIGQAQQIFDQNWKGSQGSR